jgi:hypothetical protein
MNPIIEKAKKLLEVARRGGTEAEMQTAMHHVQLLLAKHSLTMAEIEGAKVEQEPVGMHQTDTNKHDIWHRHIYEGVSKLYFCDYWHSKPGNGIRHTIVGRQSNVEMVQSTVAYLIGLGEQLARSLLVNSNNELRSRYYGSPSPRVQKAAFLKGFAYRLQTRCHEEVAKAQTARYRDVETGKELILVDAYKHEERAVATFKESLNIRFKTARSSSVIRDQSAFRAGYAAGNNVSLSNSGKQIGHNGAGRLSR